MRENETQRMTWKTWVLALLLLAVLAVPAYAAEEHQIFQVTEEIDSESFVYDPLHQMSLADEGEISLQSGEGTFLASHDSYRDQLNAPTQAIYDTIAENMAAGRYTFSVSTYGLSDVSSAVYGAYAAYDNDHPFETAVTTGRVNCNNYGSYASVTVETLGNVSTKKQLLTTAVDAFYQQFCEDGMTGQDALEQYWYIQSYMAEKLSYNTPVAQVPGSLPEEEQKNGHNAYGALVGLNYPGDRAGYVVCQGYADAYLLLCQKVGLPCVVVIGEGADEGDFKGQSNHMWNAVRLNGKWYAVDVTWDDISMSIENVPVDTYSSDYFTDNRHFVSNSQGITQDHQAFNQYNFTSGSFYIGPPPLEDARLSEERIPESVDLTVENMPVQTAAKVLNNIINGSLWLNQIPNVRFILTKDTNVSNWTMSTGKNYEIIGSGDSPVTLTLDQQTLSAAKGKTLKLENLVLKGTASGTAAIVANGDLTLRDVTIQNLSCPAVSAMGTVSLGGTCQITGNESANLQLGVSARIQVTETLDGSLIGVTFLAVNPVNYFAAPASGYTWTKSDQEAFFADANANGIEVLYDSASDRLFAGKRTVVADEGKQYSITYFMVPDPIAAGGQTVELSIADATEQGLMALAAVYDENGKVLGLQEAQVMGANGVWQIVLPVLSGEVDSYRLFFLDGQETEPLTESLNF